MKEPLGQHSRFYDKDRCRNKSLQQITSLWYFKWTSGEKILLSQGTQIQIFWERSEESNTTRKSPWDEPRNIEKPPSGFVRSGSVAWKPEVFVLCFVLCPTRSETSAAEMFVCMICIEHVGLGACLCCSALEWFTYNWLWMIMRYLCSEWRGCCFHRRNRSGAAPSWLTAPLAPPLCSTKNVNPLLAIRVPPAKPLLQRGTENIPPKLWNFTVFREGNQGELKWIVLIPCYLYKPWFAVNVMQ